MVFCTGLSTRTFIKTWNPCVFRGLQEQLYLTTLPAINWREAAPTLQAPNPAQPRHLEKAGVKLCPVRQWCPGFKQDKANTKRGEALFSPPSTRAKGKASCTNAAGVASSVLHHWFLPQHRSLLCSCSCCPLVAALTKKQTLPQPTQDWAGIIDNFFDV